MADLSEQQAPALIAPWYDLFNIATRRRCPGGSEIREVRSQAIA